MKVSAMGRVLFKVFDTLIVILCLPFYVVAIPAMISVEWLRQKRKVRMGQQIVHWVARGVREDYLVVDVSRVNEGVVGIRRRRWGLLGWKGDPPAFSDQVEFISIRRFWVPRASLVRAGQALATAARKE